MSKNDPTPAQWAASVLHGLGIHQSPGAVQALVGWMKAEGGHWNNDARYNPLNTTQAEPGSKTFRSVGAGAADIRIYKSWVQGIDATVKTLTNGLYKPILNALAAGDPGAVAKAIDGSKWGTHGSYLYSAIDSAPKVAGVHAYQPTASKQPASQPQGQQSYQTTTTPGVDNSPLRRQLVGQFLQQGGVANPQAVLSLAGTYGQAQDTPGTTTTTASPGAKVKAPKTPTSGSKGSEVLELIYNDGGKGYGIKNGQTVDGGSVYSAVWAGHASHVHVAAGPKTVVKLGKLAQSMGLNVGENPHFGGVDPVHVQGSYHYKGEAIDVSGDPAKMAAYARKVAAYNRTRALP